MKRVFIFLLVLCCGVGFASAITTPQGKVMPSDAAPLELQVLYMGGGEPKHLDAARDIYGGAGANVGGEPLIRRDENQNMVPCAADSWTAGPNATYWDFKLRKDAVWSDGVPVTADDWVYTFQHMANPVLGNPWAWFYDDIKGFAAANQGKAALSTIGVEKLDTYTIRVWGEAGPAPHLPALLSLPGGYPRTQARR